MVINLYAGTKGYLASIQVADIVGIRSGIITFLFVQIILKLSAILKAQNKLDEATKLVKTSYSRMCRSLWCYTYISFHEEA